MDTSSLTIKARLLAVATQCYSQLKLLPAMAPRSHWMPYICLFLYPIMVLQVKAGGDAMLVLLFFSGIYMLVKEKAKWDIKPILPIYYCFVFFWLVDFVTAGLAERAPVAGMVSSFTQVHFLLFPIFFLIFSILPNAFRVFMLGATLSIFTAFVVSVFQSNNFVAPHWGRAHGGINAILFANIVLVLTAQIALYALFFKRHVYWLIVSLGLVTLFLSQTRGALLALLPLIGIIAYYSWHLLKTTPKFRALFSSLMILIVCGCAYLTDFNARVKHTYDSVISYSEGSYKETSVGYRLTMYQGGLELVEKHFWLGVGRENVTAALADTNAVNDVTVVNKDFSRFTHLHSEYLTALAGSGIAGLISLLTILVAPWFIIRRYTNNMIYGCQILILCVLYAVYGVTNLAFDNGTLNGMFVIVMAIVFATYISLKNSESKENKCLEKLTKSRVIVF